MATTVTTTFHAHQPSARYGYAPPPSPPLDEASKCSLPSISNLLGLADQGSPTSETPPAAQASAQQIGNKVETRQGSTALPPSPPMSTDASFDGYVSPSTKPVVQAPNTYNYYFETTPPLVAAEARHMVVPVPRIPVQPSAFAPQYAATYLAPPPAAPYYPTAPVPGQVSGLYFQRPLPQAYPPMPVPPSLTDSHHPGTNPWQHHHYISPGTAGAHPQSQDRYICPTCSKAFSRPSSLRIHSHSHTGEKPFKCPHPGCGKAFSVRSNMKRHERGCHNTGGNYSDASSSGSNTSASSPADAAS